MGAEAGILSLEVNHELPHIWGKAPSLIGRWCGLLGEEAGHAMLIKLVGLVMQGTLACLDLLSTRSCSLSKQNHGANFFVELLLRPQRLLLNLLPLMRTFSPLTFDSGHCAHLASQDELCFKRTASLVWLQERRNRRRKHSLFGPCLRVAILCVQPDPALRAARSDKHLRMPWQFLSSLCSGFNMLLLARQSATPPARIA